MLQTATPPLLRWLCQDWGSVVWFLCQVNFGTEAYSWQIGTEAKKRGREFISARTVWRWESGKVLSWREQARGCAIGVGVGDVSSWRGLGQGAH